MDGLLTRAAQDEVVAGSIIDSGCIAFCWGSKVILQLSIKIQLSPRPLFLRRYVDTGFAGEIRCIFYSGGDYVASWVRRAHLPLRHDP